MDSSSVEGLVAAQILLWWQTAATQSTPLVVAISGPQGIGKTTLVNSLVKSLQSHQQSTLRNPRVCALSIDDLYLTGSDQDHLASLNHNNPLLQSRGNPGTHDYTLGKTLLQTIKQNSTDTCIACPQYDKSLRGGRGDRMPEALWPIISLPVDIVLFEGWCLGFRSLSKEAIIEKRQNSPLLGLYSVENLVQIAHENLKKMEESWYPFIDAFVHLSAENIKNVYQWRLEQEESLRKRLGNPHAGMSPEQVVQFVDRFMPCYTLCLEELDTQGFLSCFKQLKLILDENRKIKKK